MLPKERQEQQHIILQPQTPRRIVGWDQVREAQNSRIYWNGTGSELAKDLKNVEWIELAHRDI